MAKTFRSVTTAAVFASLINVVSGSSLAAAEPPTAEAPSLRIPAARFVDDGPVSYLRIVLPPELTSTAAATTFGVSPTDASTIDNALSFAQYGHHRDRHGWHNGAAVAAVVLGAAASITGGALLVYANRPECGTNPTAGGCSYGSKVVGGAVLAGGVVSMTAGAIMWRR